MILHKIPGDYVCEYPCSLVYVSKEMSTEEQLSFRKRIDMLFVVVHGTNTMFWKKNNYAAI
jgi:hypothetical protein